MINFKIPHRLSRLNEYIKTERGGKEKGNIYYSGRYKANKIKQDETTLCSYYIPNIKIDYPIKITYTWTIKIMSNDLGNVAFGQKFIEDAMQHKGLIRNDNLTVIKEFTHKFIKGDNEGVEVEIKKWEETE